MSKRNIAYVKPQEPAFLTRLKNQIGYKEGPTVESKKERIENFSDSDDDLIDRDTEKPIVVVLKEGDLTAEEAAQEEARIAREAAEAPADLSQRIIFKKRKKDSAPTSKETLNTASSSAAAKKSKPSEATAAAAYSSEPVTKGNKATSKKQKNSNKLSFSNHDEDEDEEEQ